MLGSLALVAGSLSTAAALPATFEGTLPVQSLGYVDQYGNLSWSHAFQPLVDRVIDQVLEVSLTVSVADDSICASQWQCLGDRIWGREFAEIFVEDQFWASGSATANVFSGQITDLIDLLAQDGIVNVTATSLQGDFDVLSSVLTVDYTYHLIGSQGQVGNGSGGSGGNGAGQVPEPSGLMLFGSAFLGLAVWLRSPRSA